MNRTDRFLAAVVKAILAVTPDALEIWFHGSRTTGTAKRNSDWDFLVVFDTRERSNELAYASGPLARLQYVDGRRTDIQSACTKDAEHEAGVLWWAIHEGRRLYPPPSP